MLKTNFKFQLYTLIIFYLCWLSPANTNEFNLRGQAKDIDLHSLANVELSIISVNDNRLLKSSTTDESGQFLVNFSIPALIKSSISAQVIWTKPGFKTRTTEVVLYSNQTQQIEIILHSEDLNSSSSAGNSDKIQGLSATFTGLTGFISIPGTEFLESGKFMFSGGLGQLRSYSKQRQPGNISFISLTYGADEDFEFSIAHTDSLIFPYPTSSKRQFHSSIKLKPFSLKNLYFQPLSDLVSGVIVSSDEAGLFIILDLRLDNFSFALVPTYWSKQKKLLFNLAAKSTIKLWNKDLSLKFELSQDSLSKFNYSGISVSSPFSFGSLDLYFRNYSREKRQFTGIGTTLKF